MGDEYSGPCSCLLNCVRSWRERDRLRRHIEFLRRGDRFKRRTFTFGFGTGHESTDVRLKPDFDTVLAWRKKSEGDKDKDWHEIDLNDIKTIEPKAGSASLVMSSKTGDLLLELEAENGSVRDGWVESLQAVAEDVRLNPQARMAQKSVKDRVKDQAQRQRHLAKRTIEMQQTKKDAEARKARYLKETGGMQYTALAMANRS
ncbi:unnamed protein product [Ectocarpus sp. 4 AP-2014]